MSAAVNRAIALLFALQGQSLDGQRLKALADAVRVSSSTTLRDLAALAEAGAVERHADDRWRLAPRLVQIAIAHQAEVARAETKISTFTGRYGRS